MNSSFLTGGPSSRYEERVTRDVCGGRAGACRVTLGGRPLKIRDFVCEIRLMAGVRRPAHLIHKGNTLSSLGINRRNEAH